MPKSTGLLVYRALQKAITALIRAATKRITVNFDATDICDPAPVSTATGGVEVFSGEAIGVIPNKGELVVPGDAFTVTATATDASDNTAVEQVTLPLAP